MPSLKKRIRQYFLILFESVFAALSARPLARTIFKQFIAYLEFPFDKDIYTEKPAIRLPLILITEVQRSGGTLLSQLFDAHPEIYAYPSELLIVKPKWPTSTLRHIKTNYRSAGRLLLRNDLFKQYAWFGYEKASGSKPQTKRFLFCFRFDIQKFLLDFHLLKARKNGFISDREIFNAYFTSFFYSWINLKQENKLKKQYITAFSPMTNIDLFNNNNARKSFLKTYPDGFIISIIRHPLDWYASAVKHSKSYSDFNEAIEVWKQSTEATMALADQENVIPILFDDLVQHTESVMSLICKKTGLQYNSVLRKPTFNGELIESDSSFEPKTGVNRDVIGRRKMLVNYDSLVAAAEKKEILSLYNLCVSRFSHKCTNTVIA